ncbi:MAG: 16S rRNA (guanine(527)-N(7))-methyltransferase RsmG [Polyangiales bacterium]
MTPFDRDADAHHLDALRASLSSYVSAKLPTETRGALLQFADLVSTWGARTDLVAARSPEALLEILCLDAFVLAEGIPPKQTLIDVGAGAGAPSLPLAVMRPDLHLTLLEPRRKRVAFMRTAVGALGLSKRVVVREGRLEGLQGERFDLALSRATFEPGEWLERAAPLADLVAVLLGTAEAPSGDIVWQQPYETAKGGARRALVYRTPK